MHTLTNSQKALLLALVAAILAITVLIISGKTGGALAAVQSVYELDRWTVDGGRGELHNGSYSLNATIGQPEAAALSGGDYTLEGGFWGGIPPTYLI